MFQINPQCNTTDLFGIIPGMNWMLHVMIFVLVFSLQASDVKSKIVGSLLKWIQLTENLWFCLIFQVGVLFCFTSECKKKTQIQMG